MSLRLDAFAQSRLRKKTSGRWRWVNVGISLLISHDFSVNQPLVFMVTSCRINSCCGFWTQERGVAFLQQFRASTARFAVSTSRGFSARTLRSVADDGREHEHWHWKLSCDFFWGGWISWAFWRLDYARLLQGFCKLDVLPGGEMVERCLKMLGVSVLAHYVILSEMWWNVTMW